MDTFNNPFTPIEQTAKTVAKVVETFQSKVADQLQPAARSVSLGGTSKVRKAGQAGIQDRLKKRSCCPEQFESDEEQASYMENYNIQEVKEREQDSKPLKWLWAIGGGLIGLGVGYTVGKAVGSKR